MDYLTIIGSLAAIFGIFKIVNEITLSRASKHRDDYDFTKVYLNDLENQNSHKFILQKGFRALTNNIYPVEEIKILLSQDNPMEIIYLRSSSKKTINYDSKEQKYYWIGIYKYKWFRKIASKLLIILYLISSFLALRPFLFNKDGITLESKDIIISISLSFFAVLAVIKHSDFIESLKFINSVDLKNLR